MIITLVKADFSSNNIGILDAFGILTNLSAGLNYNGPTSIANGDSFNTTISLVNGYTLNDISVTMGNVSLEDVITINGTTITINITAVTGMILITGTATKMTGKGTVLIDDITGRTLGGGSYGSGGIMYGVPTNLPSGTFISHIDIPACQGASYSIPSTSIVLDKIAIYGIAEDGTIKEEFVSVSNIASFMSDKEETAGKQIYRIELNRVLYDTPHLAIAAFPTNTTSAPTIPYVKGVSTLGAGYMGAVRDIGYKLAMNSTSYSPAFIIYG